MFDNLGLCSWDLSQCFCRRVLTPFACGRVEVVDSRQARENTRAMRVKKHQGGSRLFPQSGKHGPIEKPKNLLDDKRSLVFFSVSPAASPSLVPLIRHQCSTPVGQMRECCKVLWGAVSNVRIWSAEVVAQHVDTAVTCRLLACSCPSAQTKVGDKQQRCDAISG
jgi:hypothetical protein